jgi:hypothetical protein
LVQQKISFRIPAPDAGFFMQTPHQLPLSMRKASLARLLARRFNGDFERGKIGPDLFRHAVWFQRLLPRRWSEVTTREGCPDIDVSEAVVGGKADFGVCSAGVLRHDSNGNQRFGSPDIGFPISTKRTRRESGLAPV